MKRLILGLMTGLTLAASLPVAAQADPYPSRVVRFIVPATSGTIGDALTRAFASSFGRLAGQPTIVENKPGGGGIIGTQALLTAPPDGYTIMLLTTAAKYLTPLTQSVPYDPEQLKPVMSLSRHTGILVTAADSELRSLADVVAKAKAHPKGTALGLYGIHFNLSARLFEERSGVELNVIPYPGPTQTLTGLMGGTIQLALIDLGSAQPLVNSGKIRAIAVAGSNRHPLMPNVPTISESGYPGYTSQTFLGFSINSKTPQPIAQKIEELMQLAVKQPDFQEVATRTPGVEITGMPAKAFSDMIAAEATQAERLIKSMGGKIPQ